MSWLDFLILGILFISILYSFIRGAVREIFSFLALVAGYLVATRVYGYGTSYLDRFITDARLASIISFLAVFVVIVLLVGALGRMIHAAAKKTPLSFANRVLGALFGFIKGVVVISLLLLLIPVFSKSAAEGNLLKDSLVAPFFDVATEAISSAFPTRKYGALDNRLSKEMKAVRETRRKGVWSALTGLLEGVRPKDEEDPGQTKSEEKKMQDLLKQ